MQAPESTAPPVRSSCHWLPPGGNIMIEPSASTSSAAGPIEAMRGDSAEMAGGKFVRPGPLPRVDGDTDCCHGRNIITASKNPAAADSSIECHRATGRSCRFDKGRTDIGSRRNWATTRPATRAATSRRSVKACRMAES
jgi:hypothetical protein